LVVLEANAAGIPVITTTHENNAAKDLVRDKVNGYLAAPTAADLKDKIECALDSLARMTPSEGVAQYDWNLVARRLEKIIDAEIGDRASENVACA